jgi:uncharacterized repeat protein (TIGR03803 family)
MYRAYKGLWERPEIEFHAISHGIRRVSVQTPWKFRLEESYMSQGICSLVVLLGAAATVSSAQTFTKLVDFTYANGAAPASAALVQGPDGDLYGTTGYGGSCSLYDLGCGTVFKMTRSGKLTTLFSFTGPDGAFPFGALVLAFDGNFYGTTVGGGANCAPSNGCGTVFKMTPSGTLTTLYSFCSLANCADGEQPGPLIQASNGSMYGTTLLGGNSVDTDGCGTVFQIKPSGTVTTLATFPGQPGGCEPNGLVQAANGELYGTTFAGGSKGVGSVFMVTRRGTLTDLYSFCSQTDCADGEFPAGGVIQAADGNFYGVTESGGNTVACPDGCGTVFRITTRGKLTTLHSFAGTEGYDPSAGLIQATDGNLYGTTVEGGYSYKCPGGCGNIFKVTTGGRFENLYTMATSDEGEDPRSPLVQATDGIFYGNTYVGGYDGAGTVFSLSTGLGPFVETIPASGKVGALVRILGTDLTDVTCVMFNGVAAPFNRVSKTLLVARVPEGATTGFVTVTASGRTLKSNVEFRVP